MKTVRRFIGGCRDIWIDNVWSDYALAIVAVGLHWAAVSLTGRFDVMQWVSSSDRRGAYAATAIVVSLVGSIGGIAVGQVGSAKGERIRALKIFAGSGLAANWTSIFRGAMFAALLAILALVLDPASPSADPTFGITAAPWIFEFALTLASMKFLRLSVLLRHVIGLTSLDAAEEGSEVLRPPPKLDTRWSA